MFQWVDARGRINALQMRSVMLVLGAMTVVVVGAVLLVVMPLCLTV